MSAGDGEQDFRVPDTVRAVVPVEQGRVGLVEAASAGLVAAAARPGNGIVAAVEGGLVVFTTREHCEVDFRVQVLPDAPDDVLLRVFEDVVEVSYHALAGSGDVVAPSSSAGPFARAVRFPEPGPVRARLHRGVWEHSGLITENYVVQLWQAPEAPEHVLRTAAGVAAGRAAGPERTYRWIENSALSQAGCLTFAPGATDQEVLDAFGAGADADADATLAWSQRHETLALTGDPFIGLLSVPGGVVAVEDNRWTGSEPWVLQALSRPGGRAASAFWNVNALTRLSFARDGTVLASAEWGLETVPADLDPEVADAVAGIDYQDAHASAAKDVLAAARFTGLTLRSEDLDTLEATGRAYRVIPPLPALHPVPRPPRGGAVWFGERRMSGYDLSELAEEFAAHPAATLTDLAHWAATQALAAVDLAEDPTLAPALQRLADHPGAPLEHDAAMLVRRSSLHRPAEFTAEQWTTRRYAFTALHQATNPDPLGAAAGALGFTSETLHDTRADFLGQARQRAARS